MTNALADIIWHHNICETFDTLFSQSLSYTVPCSLWLSVHGTKFTFKTSKCDGQTWNGKKFQLLYGKFFQLLYCKCILSRGYLVDKMNDLLLMLKLELVSKELNHLGTILHVFAGVWFLWSKKICFFVIIFQKEKGNTFTLLIFFKVKSLQKEQNSTNLLLWPPICGNKHAITPKWFNSLDTNSSSNSSVSKLSL